MKRLLCYIVTVIAAVAMYAAPADQDSLGTRPMSSRRHITPVKPQTNVVLLPGKNVDDKALEQYLTGDSTKYMEEMRQDSIKRSYTRYPKYTDMAVGLNFIDIFLAAAGQDYFNLDASFTVNMWNRVQPVFELGIGRAKSTPDDMNYTYSGKVAPFVRLGANYNLMFKNSPDYQALLGLRLGSSIFKYDVTGIHHHNGYWNEDVMTEIKNQTGRALWFEAVAGIKVKVYKQISLGWQAKFHAILGENKAPQGKPWFIPGYGTRGSIAFAFNVYYTLPIGKSSLKGDKKTEPEASAVNN